MTLIIGYQGTRGRQFFAADRCASSGSVQHPTLKTHVLVYNHELYLIGFAGAWGFTGALLRSLEAGEDANKRVELCKNYNITPNASAGVAAKIPLVPAKDQGIVGRLGTAVKNRLNRKPESDVVRALRENHGYVRVDPSKGIKLYYVLADGDFREALPDVVTEGSGREHATGFLNGYIAGKGEAPNPTELFSDMEASQVYVSDEYDAFYIDAGFLYKESYSRADGKSVCKVQASLD